MLQLICKPHHLWVILFTLLSQEIKKRCILTDGFDVSQLNRYKRRKSFVCPNVCTHNYFSLSVMYFEWPGNQRSHITWLIRVVAMLPEDHCCICCPLRLIVTEGHDSDYGRDETWANEVM